MMRDKKIIALAAFVAVLAAVIIYNLYSIVAVKQTIVQNDLPQKMADMVASPLISSENQVADQAVPDPFAAPLDRAGERVTKKPFGIFITPQNSPVQPEKFRGWHTGADFEIFPEELNADVAVKAICDGKIALKKTASGYGGILVQNCELDGQLASPKPGEGGPITVIYGHLKLASITKKTGASLSQGEEIGILGKAGSLETSGERKHLHLGIHRGASVNILGYVQKQGDLSAWLDPCSLDTICK